MKKIRSVMIAIGIVALNLALGRFLLFYNEKLLAGIAIGLLAMQATLLLQIRCGKRAFLIGFLTFGTLALTCFAWGEVFQGPIRVSYVGGSAVYTQYPGSYGADAIQAFWDDYQEWAAQYATRLHLFSYPQPSIWLVLAVVLFLPQLLAGLTGGLLTTGLSCAVKRYHRPSAPAIA